MHLHNNQAKWKLFVFTLLSCFRFCYKVIAVSAQLCPMSVAATLVSIGNDEGDDADRLRRACVATLCELGNVFPLPLLPLLK